MRERLGPLFNPDVSRAGLARHARRRWAESESAVRRWNDVAIDTSGIDHAPVSPAESRQFGEQLGPGRSARAMAIVHIAIFDAVNAIAGGHRGYTGLPRVTEATSMEAAVAQAAHDTLVAMFPSQAPSLDELLAEDLGRIRLLRPSAKAAGSPWASARPRRSSRCARTTDHNMPSRAWARTICPAPRPASGGKTR